MKYCRSGANVPITSAGQMGLNLPNGREAAAWESVNGIGARRGAFSILSESPDKLSLRNGDLPREKRIVLALVANRRQRTVSRYHDGLVGQGQNRPKQRLHNLFERASGQVGSANGARKKCVPSNKLL